MNTYNPVVGEWIDVAEHDLGSAMVLAEIPYYAPACVHCQQSVEKILKAYIIANGGALKKIHELNVLVEDCEKYSPDFGRLKKICSYITLYTTVRYPPFGSITAENMELLLKNTREVFDFTILKLKNLGYNVPESSTKITIEEIKEAVRVLREQKKGRDAL